MCENETAPHPYYSGPSSAQLSKELELRLIEFNKNLEGVLSCLLKLADVRSLQNEQLAELVNAQNHDVQQLATEIKSLRPQWSDTTQHHPIDP